jgi:hypothetical protein
MTSPNPPSTLPVQLSTRNLNRDLRYEWRMGQRRAQEAERAERSEARPDDHEQKA